MPFACHTSDLQRASDERLLTPPSVQIPANESTDAACRQACPIAMLSLPSCHEPSGDRAQVRLRVSQVKSPERPVMPQEQCCSPAQTP